MARILVVEDEPVAGMLLSELLLDIGHGVGVITDGNEAYAVMLRRPPDLAILDCGLPGLSGIELLRKMRSHPHLATIPVLMLTARQSPRDEELAITAGAQDYLRKPIDPDKLLGRLDALMLKAKRDEDDFTPRRAAGGRF